MLSKKSTRRQKPILLNLVDQDFNDPQNWICPQCHDVHEFPVTTYWNEHMGEVCEKCFKATYVP